MTQEEKQLLLKDLGARLPYHTKIDTGVEGIALLDGTLYELNRINLECGNDVFLPYLRPMSSMTEVERLEFSKLLDRRYCEEDWEGHISTSYCIEIDNVYTDDEGIIKYPSSFSMDAIDWLNAHHFDYRGLIEQGLALEAPKDMYKLNKDEVI